MWKLDVVQFEPVAGHVEQLPSEVLQSMSHDQQELLELALAVQNGTITGAADYFKVPKRVRLVSVPFKAILGLWDNIFALVCDVMLHFK